MFSIARTLFLFFLASSFFMSWNSCAVIAASTSKLLRIPLTQTQTSSLGGSNLYTKYSGVMSVGSSDNFKNFSMVFDITNPVTFIPSQGCKICSSNNCAILLNNTIECDMSFKCSSSKSNYQNLYSIYYVSGRIASSFLKFPGEILLNYKFLLADEISGTQLFDDQTYVFGLGINTPVAFDGIGFTSQLSNGQIIGQPIFSFFFSIEYPYESELLFGGYDDSKMKDSANIMYHQTIPKTYGYLNDYWSIPMPSIKFGRINVQYTNSFAKIDSVNEIIYLGRDIYSQIKSVLSLQFNARVSNETQQIFIDCNADLPELEINLSTNDLNTNQVVTYYIPKELYLKQYSSNSNECLLLITYQEGGSAILGTAFLSGYISIFNQNSQTIGFSQSIQNPYTKKMHWLLIVVLIGAGLVVIMVIFAGIRWKMNKNKTKLAAKLLQDNQAETNV